MAWEEFVTVCAVITAVERILRNFLMFSNSNKLNSVQLKDNMKTFTPTIIARMTLNIYWCIANNMLTRIALAYRAMCPDNIGSHKIFLDISDRGITIDTSRSLKDIQFISQLLIRKSSSSCCMKCKDCKQGYLHSGQPYYK